ncbi:MAG: EAL domain-containing protein [Devosiaceae bacterium]|nr:EAL domain-containing protein [Devosiaceae bacterium]
MQSRTNTILLIIAILAFVPILAIGFVLDGYIKNRESSALLRSANEISSETQTAVYEAIDLMQAVLAGAPSLCTPSFMDVLYLSMQRSSFVRQVVVKNQLGVRYCEALGGAAVYDTLSEELSIPGRRETISAVRMPGVEAPALRVTFQIDENKSISAFVTVNHLLSSMGLPLGLQDASMLRMVFADGTELFSIGGTKGESFFESSGDYLKIVSLAGEVPLRLEVAVPFSKIRARYADLYIWMTIIACLFSASILFGAIIIVRKSSLPSFDLEHAIARGEIRPYYQPIVDITTGRIYGCEMLARWVKENGEIISPAAFIEYAEISGLAIPMTICLMEAVRKDMEDICAANPDIKISINLFEGHFRDGSVVDDVQAIFGDSKINLRQLVFEITERHPLGDDVQANSVITGLQAMGCKVAMDDVGTGHSNLAYIQSLGIDIIKIDKVFIDPIIDQATTMPILDSLISLAKDLKTGIIAEGVENEEQAIYLRSKGVKNVQGYLFSPAIVPEQYIKMVEALNSGAPPKQTNLELTESEKAAA